MIEKYQNISKVYNEWQNGELKEMINQEIVKIEECQKILNNYRTLASTTQKFLEALKTFEQDFYNGKIGTYSYLYDSLSVADQKVVNNHKQECWLQTMTPSLLEQLLTNHGTNSMLDDFLDKMRQNVYDGTFVPGNIRNLLQVELLKCVSTLADQIDLQKLINSQLNYNDVAEIIDYQAYYRHDEEFFKDRQKNYKDMIDTSLNTRKNDLKEIDAGCNEIAKYLKENNHKELTDEVIKEALKDPTWLETLCHRIVEAFSLKCETNIKRRTSFVELLNAQEGNSQSIAQELYN